VLRGSNESGRARLPVGHTASGLGRLCRRDPAPLGWSARARDPGAESGRRPALPRVVGPIPQNERESGSEPGRALEDNNIVSGGAGQ